MIRTFLFGVIREISVIFPGSKQVREVGLEGKKDLEIWKWAKQQGFTIVTFDVDYVDFSLLFNFPPKVIWLRLGNSSTKNIATQLVERRMISRIFYPMSMRGF